MAFRVGTFSSSETWCRVSRGSFHLSALPAPTSVECWVWLPQWPTAPNGSYQHFRSCPNGDIRWKKADFTRLFLKSKKSPGQVAQLFGALSHTPKGCGFDSWSGHKLGCRFDPRSGCIWEATCQRFSPLSLKSINAPSGEFFFFIKKGFSQKLSANLSLARIGSHAHSKSVTIWEAKDCGREASYPTVLPLPTEIRSQVHCSSSVGRRAIRSQSPHTLRTSVGNTPLVLTVEVAKLKQL